MENGDMLKLGGAVAVGIVVGGVAVLLWSASKVSDALGRHL